MAVPMSTKTLRTICEGLNAEPFRQNLTLVKLDSQTPEKLLQTLSDVICWIQGLNESMDIRSESPDETAIRILNALRIFKYPPPRDIDQIQKWRLDILEGNKSAVYPALEWIFENVERLKERVYLASYLTKLEVPPEEQTPETIRLINVIEEKMEEFKVIHSRIVETRSDFVRAEDVRSDLKAMDEEKEQLTRKIERSRRKLARCPDLEKHLEVAAKLHFENERQQELQLQHQEQRNALVHVGQRLTRLEKTLKETKLEYDTTDPKALITKLQREIEVSNYVVNEKMVSSIATQKANIEVVQKILAMQNVTKDDVARLKNKIDRLNSEINDTIMQRDKKDEGTEDKLILYRHQSANIQKKKANVADTLQTTKQEWDKVEATLATKKREISMRTGQEEIISSIQYRTYVKKLRNKSNFYKRKKAELEQARSEAQVLERTVELLEQRFEEIKQDCIDEGRGVIETLNDSFSQARPQTAKPTTTDVTDLRQMTKELNDQLNEKRENIQRLSGDIDRFCREHKEDNDRFYSFRKKFKTLNDEVENEKKQAEKIVQELEIQLKSKEEELRKNSENFSKLEWFGEKMRTPQLAEDTVQFLERENAELSSNIIEYSKRLEKVSQNNEAINQLAMWNSLAEIFRIKINLLRQRNDGDKPIGDDIYY